MSKSWTTRLGPHLKQIYPDDGFEKNNLRSNVVVIPDFDVEAVSTSWYDGENCWLKSRLPSMIPDPCVLSFEPGIRTGHEFSWQNIITYGDRLLEELLHRVTSDALRGKLLFFVCHGLGGLLFKRAATVLFERYYDPVYQELLSLIGGVVFLGTPSPLLNRTRDLQRMGTILKAITKASKKTIERTSQHLALTATISRKFSDSGFEAPVLSVFGTKVSKISKNIFSVREVLVDQVLCETFTKRERIVGLECSHGDLSSVESRPNSESALLKELGAFFELAMESCSIRSAPSPRSSSNKDSWKIDLVEELRLSDAQNERTKQPSSRPSISTSTRTRFMSDYDSISITSKLTDQSLDADSWRAKLPCYSFGPHIRSLDFVGRQDVLSKLDSVLIPGNYRDPDPRNNLKTFALCGVGGVGKTSIAIEFAYSRKDEFDAIFWIHAADTSRLASDFAYIAVQLSLEDSTKEARDQIVARNSVLGWLSNPVESRRHSTQDLSFLNVKWLLIFDNAERLGDLRDYWPVHSAGSILVTSRDPLAMTQTYFQLAQGMELEPFNLVEAADWLRILSQQGQTPEEVILSEKIVNKLSGLPLAISQVAAAIHRRQLSLAEFLDFYSEEAFRTDIYRDPAMNGYECPIWTTFAFDELSKSAVAIIHILCFLNPDSVPESLLTDNVKGAEGTLSIDLDGFPKSNMELMKARTELVSSFLIKRNIQSRELTIHRIVQAASTASMSSERLQKVFHAILKRLVQAWPELRFEYDYSQFRQCELLLPHVVYLLSQFEMSQTLQALRVHNTEFASLLVSAGWYLSARGGYTQALPLNRAAQRLAEEAPVVDNMVLAMTHNNHFEHAFITSDYDNALLHSQAFVKLAEKHPDIQARNQSFGFKYLAYNDLAEALMCCKRWDEAITYCDRAIHARSVDGIGLSPAGAMYNKAHCLWRKGLPDAAWKVLEEYASMRQNYFSGGEAFKIAMSVLEQGNVREAQARWDESLEHYLEAYQRFLKIFGHGHFRVAAVGSKLGQHYERLGDYKKARYHLKQALRDYGNVPYRAAEITRTTFLLVNVLERIGDPSAAETRRGAENELLELSLKTGRRLKEDDLDDIVAFWS